VVCQVHLAGVGGVRRQGNGVICQQAKVWVLKTIRVRLVQGQVNSGSG
jgi:hypothetical protein